MIVTLGVVGDPGADDGWQARGLGLLLHKHPDRVHVAELPFGTAHVHYPQADADRCTAALQVEIDPICLARTMRSVPAGFALGQYVNDRSYTASSLLAVAIGRLFGTALASRCTGRQELVRAPAGAGRRQALLGGRRRDRQAAALRGGVAR